MSGRPGVEPDIGPLPLASEYAHGRVVHGDAVDQLRQELTAAQLDRDTYRALLVDAHNAVREFINLHEEEDSSHFALIDFYNRANKVLSEE